MERLRFGMGALAGLALGLCLVLASFAASTFTLFGSFTASHASDLAAHTSSRILTTTTSAPVFAVGGNSTQMSKSVTGTVTSSQSNSQPPSLNVTQSYVASLGTTNPQPSRLANLATQPLLLNSIVIFPLLIALALGLVVYQISARERAESL